MFLIFLAAAGASAPTATEAAFDIPAKRSDYAARLLHECLFTNARRIAGAPGAEVALRFAWLDCWVLRREYRETLRPVAEAVMRREGTANPPPDAVDMIADEVFNQSIADIEANVASTISPTKR